ncbi:MAG: rppH [Candidatus Midichloriaceae bacterium]|jgi:putative (di)nucleoside polyphosphate hydrolase|nr:rppH [Candidatus Midichloriaceae bacterium]
MNLPLSSLGYRSGVGIMLVNDSNRVFVGKRIERFQGMSAWQMPQGGMDDNESPIEAAKRELLEETGVNSAEILAEHTEWLYYDLPSELIGKVWGGRYRGQKQKWFLMRLVGGDSQINIHTSHAEFNEWKWERVENLESIIVPFKRDIYRKVITQFAPLLDI